MKGLAPLKRSPLGSSMSSESPKSESPNRNLGGLRSLQPNKTALEKKDSPLKITDPKMQGLSSSLKLGKCFLPQVEVRSRS